MKRYFLVVGVVSLALLGACDKKSERGKSEELTIVVEADRSKLSADEKDFRARQKEFESERTRLREEKAKLMQDKEQTRGKDKSQAHRLKELEKRLWEKERSMWNREANLEKERRSLASNKSALIDKVAGGVGGGVASSPAAREKAVALREKGLAGREKDLAVREKDLSRREAALAKREAAFLETQTKLASMRVPAPVRVVSHSGGKVSRRDAEKALKAVTRGMQKRGILWGDLPPELAGLKSEIYAAKKKGDYSRSRDLIAQLQAALSAMVIDSGYIDRKFARLNQLIKRKPPKNKSAVSSALRKATQLVGDGKFQAANRELNRIFALLNR